MAEQAEMKTLQSITDEVPTEDSTDDFELISADPSLHDVLNSPVMENGSLPEEKDHSGDHKSMIRTIDPVEAFEMIQSEHRLLKDELTAQNRMLRERLLDYEEHERRKAAETSKLKEALDASTMENKSLVIELSESSVQMSSLKEEVEVLRAQLKEKAEQQGQLEGQLKVYKEVSETVDHLTAQLLEKEDIVKTQHAMIQQFQNDGFVNVAQLTPSMSADQATIAELSKKDEHIKRLEGVIARLEGSLSTVHGERLKLGEEIQQLRLMNSELQELVTDLQTQAESDKAEWAAIRVDLEQQIQILTDRVMAFERHFSSAPSMNAELPIHTLTHTDMQSSQTLRTGPPCMECQECPRCHLPMMNIGPHPCPSIIDGLD